MILRKILPKFLLCVLQILPVMATEHAVTQKDRLFSKTEVTIHPGDVIVFKNADEVVHNVFSSTRGMEFEIRRQAPGGSSRIPFPNEGTAEVRCSIHPKMKLVVTVKK